MFFTIKLFQDNWSNYQLKIPWKNFWYKYNFVLQTKLEASRQKRAPSLDAILPTCQDCRICSRILQIWQRRCRWPWVPTGSAVHAAAGCSCGQWTDRSSDQSEFPWDGPQRMSLSWDLNTVYKLPDQSLNSLQGGQDREQEGIIGKSSDLQSNYTCSCTNRAQTFIGQQAWWSFGNGLQGMIASLIECFLFP